MSDNNIIGSVVGGGIGGWMFFLILWASLGYFIYNGTSGAVAIALLCVLYGLVLLFSLIPFCGAAIQCMVMYLIVWPWVSSLAGIGATWLTTMIFWFSLIAGIIITLVTTIITIVMIKDR